MRGQGNRNRGNRGRFRDNRRGRFEGQSRRPGGSGDKPVYKRRHIRHEGKRRGDRGKKADDRDLDRQLRDYWIKQKGGQGQGDGKELARERLNAEMEDYWKKGKEEGEGDKKEEKDK